MTLVYQCDRCKKVFKNIVDTDNSVRNVHEVEIDVPRMYASVEKWDEGARLNLCGDCLKEFYTWVGFVNTEKIERDKWRKQMEEDKKAVQNSKKKKKLF